jgi:hypothetical protein
VTLFGVLARLVLARLRWLFAGGEARDAEILALRHQVLMLQRQINRPPFNDTDRTILALLSSVMDQASTRPSVDDRPPSNGDPLAPTTRRPSVDPNTHHMTGSSAR